MRADAAEDVREGYRDMDGTVGCVEVSTPTATKAGCCATVERGEQKATWSARNLKRRLDAFGRGVLTPYLLSIIPFCRAREEAQQPRRVFCQPELGSWHTCPS